jgi:CheY-like chemotaxis protein
MMPSSPCVIVVDDDPTIREILALTLELEGYQVATASNGKEALALVEADPPAVILLDIHMPILDGPGFVRELQSRGLKLPVIVLSADREGVGNQAALQMNAVEFVAKPFEVRQILELVQRYCSPSSNL